MGAKTYIAIGLIVAGIYYFKGCDPIDRIRNDPYLSMLSQKKNPYTIMYKVEGNKIVPYAVDPSKARQIDLDNKEVEKLLIELLNRR